MVETSPLTISPVVQQETARACASLRRRVFLTTYGPLGLTDWPGEPDGYDAGPGFLAVRQNGRLVGTMLLRHAIYDPAQPFWHERFGVPLRELIPRAEGRRIAEVGRLAVDKGATDRPLEVAAALAEAMVALLRAAGLMPVVAAAMSPAMLAFYQDLARRHGAGLRVHPRQGTTNGIALTLMVLRLPDDDVF